MIMKYYYVLLLLCFFCPSSSSVLMVGFYSETCPHAEMIIRNTTESFLSKTPSLAAPLLRLQFHDCFVRGCEGSILLNFTSNRNEQTEKMALPNLSLKGFEVIEAVKDELERVCPQTVSCADILALVARAAVSLMYGPTWEVPLGRRDGKTSLASEVLSNLPSPFSNISTLKTSFLQKGLTVKEDLAVLSGAHTIGMAHCIFFENRLYNFTGKGDTDPAMDPAYVNELKRKCKPEDAGTSVEMDLNGSKRFDESYYRGVGNNRGLFQSDEALLHDPLTRSYVFNIQAAGSFWEDFGESMIKMGSIGVLTGKNGEIRKHCAFVN